VIKKLVVLIAAFAHAVFAAQPADARPAIEHAFVIAMENATAAQIYGNGAGAPYINNSIIPKYAHARNFNDLLPALPSEPHYLLMEAGTNVFRDTTFLSNADPSTDNSTASRKHLVTQMKKSGNVTWMTYQEDINSDTGRCPIVSVFPYTARHNPFVFFQDVSGDPPSKTNKYCMRHTKPYSKLKGDLAADRIANYVFITPNLCNIMHGDPQCPAGDRITAGDTWLSKNLPPIVRWARRNAGVIFIVWDEGGGLFTMPFLAIGRGVRSNFSNDVPYDHRSLVKTIQVIFGLPILPAVKGSNDFRKLFKRSAYP